MHNALPTLAALALTPLLGAQADPARATDDFGTRAAAILEQHVDAVVTIKAVVKIEVMGQGREHRLVSQGIAVTADGLIMTNVGTIEPNVNVRGRNQEELDVKITPQDLKIVFGNEDEEHAAFLVGKDTKLGLAFLQLEKLPEGETLHVVDFGGDARPEVGQEVVTISRLSKGFDYAGHFREARVIGRLRKPRKAFLVDRGSDIGLPVYGLDGTVLGVNARLSTEISEGIGGENAAAVILTNNIVAGAVGAAQRQAAEMKKDDGGPR